MEKLHFAAQSLHLHKNSTVLRDADDCSISFQGRAGEDLNCTQIEILWTSVTDHVQFQHSKSTGSYTRRH